MNTPRKCPHCSSEHFFRSRRKLADVLMLFHQPYKCYEPGCERRSLVPEWSSRNTVAPLSNERRAIGQPLVSRWIDSTSLFRRRPERQQALEAGLAHQLGSRFVVDEMEDLERLTDLLDLSGDYLNLLFAVASYVQRVPGGRDRLTQAVIERRGRSAAQLALAV